MIIALLGPTATGKTALSVDIANEFLGEIVSCDSVAVYKGFDIGSAKPTKEERGKALFHLVDFADPKTPYNVGEFQEDAHRVIDDIIKRGRLPILSGGSGLYAQAALEGIDKIPPIPPEIREKVNSLIEKDYQGAVEKFVEIDPLRAGECDLKNPRRVAKALEIYYTTGKAPSVVYKESKKDERPPYMCFCLTAERDLLIERINKRVDLMVKAGLFEEVHNLLNCGIPKDCQPMSSIGYKECVEFFEGKYTKEEAIEKIKIATRQFAKRQRTWFRGMKNVLWVDINDINIIKEKIKTLGE